MRTLATALVNQAAAADAAPVLLAEIAGWGGQTVRWVDDPATYTWGGQVYQSRPLGVGAVQAAAGSSARAGASLTVANHDLAVSALVAAARPLGAAVTVRRVYRDAPTESQVLVGGLVVTAYRLTETLAELLLSAPAEGLRQTVPARFFGRGCPWVFRGADCGYSGTALYCSATQPATGPDEKSPEACQALNNWPRYGGFVVVLPRRREG